jgi:hypothetical protein
VTCKRRVIDVKFDEKTQQFTVTSEDTHSASRHWNQVL